jgi:hypothetical protein
MAYNDAAWMAELLGLRGNTYDEGTSSDKSFLSSDSVHKVDLSEL